MALRQIHNALLPPPDHRRPSKKPSPNPTPPPPMPLQDENAAPADAAAAAIDYVASEHLQPLTDPDLTILGLVEGLESADWIQICDSLNDLRRFAIHHSPLLLPVLEKALIVTVKAMKNPRSALCKTSIMAASDIFTAFGDTLLLEETVTADSFDQLLLQLLLKASQDKKFVCEEADRALKMMAVSMTPLPLLRKLQKHVTHTNPRIRAKASVSVSNCVSKMVLQQLFFLFLSNLCS
uniref:TOG domain-containing protein n=1 Tax=Kalanchoe fedtschenkoi TaxID=63787 RepID=A0A7N1A1Y4_KALFE